MTLRKFDKYLASLVHNNMNQEDLDICTPCTNETMCTPALVDLQVSLKPRTQKTKWTDIISDLYLPIKLS